MPTPIDTFLAEIDERFVPIVRALDSAVRQGGGELDCAIKWRMLMYTLGQNYQHWICAIGVTKKTVCLRFLYGVMLDDPRGVLRAGTSILKTLDIATLDGFDPQLVADYVAEAVAKHAAFKAGGKP